jgi:hypothetical protein
MANEMLTKTFQITINFFSSYIIIAQESVKINKNYEKNGASMSAKVEISSSIEITDTNFPKVFNFWKVESLDNQYFRPLSKMSIISVELLKII